MIDRPTDILYIFVHQWNSYLLTIERLVESILPVCDSLSVTLTASFGLLLYLVEHILESLPKLLSG